MSIITEDDLSALKTISGAIRYTLIRYNESEIPAHEWKYLSGYLKISSTSIYSIMLTSDGFELNTKNMTMKYTHNAFHCSRVITIIRL